MRRRRAIRIWGILVLTVVAGGCTSGPLLDNPVHLRPEPGEVVEDPIYVPQGPAAYAGVFENVLDILGDYFEIAYANRYDGRLRTFPRVVPGLERPWLPGAPDLDQRLLASLQTVRQRAEVEIQPADDGGFFVDVKVYRELEDLPRPIRSTAAAAFRTENSVERQFEVIDPSAAEGGWIPLGRNTLLEQIILLRIKKCL